MIAIKVTQTAEVKIGEWYLWLPCENCPYPIAIIKDANRRAINALVGHKIVLQVACPKCGHEGCYPTYQAERWQACAVL